MIKRDPPQFWDVLCDRCPAGEERISTDECQSFMDVVNEIKERGWGVRKDRDGWLHICPACVEESRAAE